MALSGPGETWLKSRPGWWGELPVIGVSVWYEGGGVARSWFGPDDGVQVVCAYHPEGRRTFCHGYDEYTDPLERGAPKSGLQIDPARFQRIYEAALADNWRAD